MSVPGTPLRGALERAEGVLLCADGLAATLVRHAAGCPWPEDGARLRARAAELAAQRAGDGSWSGPRGALAATARALLELAELHALAPLPDAAQTVAPALAWLQARRGAPGRFGERCSAEFHRAGLCHHFVTGFHAPPEPLPPGAPADALVVDSALALRAALLWGAGGTTVELHLDGLRQVIRHWAWPAGAPLLSARAGVAALAAVLDAEHKPANIAAAADGIACAVRSQRSDGTWHGVELFDVLEVLLLGVERGYHVPEVDATLGRAARLLALSQKGDGTWGAERDADPGRLPYIAWRVLRHALAHDDTLQVTPASGSPS